MISTTLQSLPTEKIGATDDSGVSATASRKLRRVGVIRGNEALDVLLRIPRDDPAREPALQLVRDWIKCPSKTEIRGDGAELAAKAIGFLKAIPERDCLRRRGFQIVRDFLRRQEKKFGTTPTSAVPADTLIGCEKMLESHAKAIESEQDHIRKTTANSVLKIGERLAAAQALMAHRGNGAFGDWVKDRLGMSRMSAYRMIASYEAFREPSLSQIVTNFDASAMYALSNEDAPKEAIVAAKSLAESGEKVTYAVAKQLIAEAGGKPLPVPDDGGEWDLETAIEKTDEALHRLEKRWPKTPAGIESFGNMLIDRGQGIIKTGGLP